MDGEAVVVLFFVNFDTNKYPVSELLVSLRYCSIRDSMGSFNIFLTEHEK